MNNTNQQTDTESVKQATCMAVEADNSLQEEVRNITLKALSEGHLDREKISQVIHAVTEGISLGAEAKGTAVKETLREAISGMDEALAKSAEASRLAIEETAGRAKDFTHHDLRLALDNLQTLENLFVDTMHEAGKGANDMVKETLADLIKHAQHSGTSVGRTSAEAVHALTEKLGNTLKETAADSAKATLDTGAHIASVAAGILAGIADALQSIRKK